MSLGDMLSCSWCVPAGELPSDAVIHTNKRGNFYEDFYKVIVQGENISDWTSCLVDIKKHFLHLQQFMKEARGDHAIISHASEGNILEAINLAVNVYEKNFQNCNFQLTGQQIVLVTPGVGVFEVERELTMMTRERIIDSGVGVDLVSLSQQPLHAVPLFKFFSQSSMDNQEYYNLPHWINYSFYNPVHAWNQFQFQPMLNLSDHLINVHLNKSKVSICQRERSSKGLPYQPTKEAGLVPHTISSIETLQRSRLFGKYLVDYDEYDAAIFCSKDGGSKGKLGSKGSGMPKVHSVGKLAASPDGRYHQRSLGDQFTSAESSRSQGVKFEITSSPDEDPFLSDAMSPPNDMKLSAVSEDASRDAGNSDSAVPARPSRVRVLSESQNPSSSILATSSSQTLYVPAASSAESLPKYSRLMAHTHGKEERNDGIEQVILVPTKKTKFINPFDPSKVHGELTAYHRRWVHVFPRDKRGLAFQAHHALEEEEEEDDEERFSASGTISPVRDLSSSSLNIGSFTKLGTSLTDRQEFRGLVQAGRRSRYISGSSLVETLVPMSAGSGSVDSQSVGAPDKVYCPPTSSTPSQHPTKWDDYGIGPEDLKGPVSPVTPKPVWIRRKKRALPCERRLSDASLKGVEDFTSVQRTGVDWKSLTDPACLPVTVDFFPAESRLNQDYYQSPLELVANCCQNEFDDNTGTGNKYQCSWIADHQKVDTFEAFREMISQRLSQGFQLVFTSKDVSSSKTSSLRWSGQNGCHHNTNIFALNQMLREQKELLTKKSTNKRRKDMRGHSTDICVKLSLGKVFQELKLVYPHIHVTIYRQKVQYNPRPYEYSYNLCRSWPMPQLSHSPSKEASPLLGMHATFSYKRTEDYNWNYLDHHVCGHSDFEVLQESHRYWRCRYLLLPATPFPMQSPTSQQTEEEKQMMASREATLVANFVRFLEFLNHIKRMQNPGSSSISLQSSKLLKRNMSLPASHASLYGSVSSRNSSSNLTSSVVPSTSSSADFTSRVVSPGLSSMSIQSPSGSRFLKKTSEGYTTTMTGDPPGRSQSSRHSTPLHSKNNDQENRLQVKKTGSSVGDILSSPVPSSHVSSGNQLSSYSGGGSPRQLRRRKSRDDMLMVSPAPDRSASREGRREGNLAVDLPTSGRSSRESSDQGTESSGLRMRDLSPTSARSPETIMDDVSTSISSFDASIQLLNVSSPSNLILRQMENSADGLDFLAPHTGLKTGSCFVAMEAVDWAKERITGVKTRRDAIKIFQEMVQEQLIVHASMDLSIPFLDGYLLYCIPQSKNSDALGTVKESGSQSDVGFYVVSPDYESFCKRWFEVVVLHPSANILSAVDQPTNTIDLSPASASPFVYSAYSNFSSSSTQTYYRDNVSQLPMRIPSTMHNRYVELNPDPQLKSDRPEWCFVRYDHTYNPSCGFQFEFQWMVTTVVLISQLIQNWSHKAGMCGFNLVPVPILSTLSKDEGDSTPFTTRTYIPLHLPPSFPGTAMPLSQAVGNVMAAILQKLGFMLDPASVSDDLQDLNLTLPITSRIYIHYTGLALVGPTCTDSVVRLMERDRRTRTSSLGTTLGRGDFADYNYMGEIMTGSQVTLGEAGRLIPENSSYGGNWNSFHTPKLPHQMGKPNDTAHPLQCGFYWYRNMALYRHKGGDRGGASSDYGNLQEKMIALCSNKDGSLTQLCVDILGSDFKTSDSD